MENKKDNQLEVFSISEALKLPSKDLIVKEGNTFELSPENKESSGLWHHILLSSFKDLQQLKFIPENIDEKSFYQAIEKDQEESLEIFKRNISPKKSDCDCHGHQSDSSFTKEYQKFETQYNLNVAAILSKAFKGTKTTDHKYIKMTVSLVKQLLDHGRFVIPGIFLRNIIVHTNALLSIKTGKVALSANDIKIYRGGRIDINSSFIKINCNSLQGNI